MNNTSEWYAAENDMTNFYDVTERPEVRDSYLNDFRQSADATTRAFGREREQIIREMDAGTRHKALFVVDLWNECSDGENGYRSRWIRRKH